MWWIIVAWVVLILVVVAFNYISGEGNKRYDYYGKQQRCLDKYVDNQTPAFVKYIGDDRLEIQCNQYTLITIDITEDNKIRVELEDTYILYDDLKHFNYDWRFEDEE